MCRFNTAFLSWHTCHRPAKKGFISVKQSRESDSRFRVTRCDLAWACHTFWFGLSAHERVTKKILRRSQTRKLSLGKVKEQQLWPTVRVFPKVKGQISDNDWRANLHWMFDKILSQTAFASCLGWIVILVYSHTEVPFTWAHSKWLQNFTWPDCGTSRTKCSTSNNISWKEIGDFWLVTLNTTKLDTPC